MKPTIDVFIVAWNEQAMIKHAIIHYLKFCRSITVYDNMSTDKTVQVAMQYSDVKIIPFDTGNKIDEREYLKIKNNCWKKSDANFVIVCDADEFLYSENIVEKLEYAHANNIFLPEITGYNMYYEDFTEQKFTHDGPIREIKMGVKDPAFNKQVIFNPFAVKEINYRPGAHMCVPELQAGYLKIMQHGIQNLMLLHYKYINREYVKAKHAAYAQRLSEFNNQFQYGAEYRDTTFIDRKFEQLKKKCVQVI